MADVGRRKYRLVNITELEGHVGLRIYPDADRNIFKHDTHLQSHLDD